MAQWKEITTVREWEESLERSQAQPVMIMKHSTTCPISAAALTEYEGFLNEADNQDTSYVLVKVIESRPVSNQIAEDMKVKHESPQTLLIKNKEAVWHASHWKITKQALRQISS